MKVAVVIPTRDEAPTIAGVTAAADAGLRSLGVDALIVNADGGSTDGTAEAFLATPTATPKRLLRVEGEPGKGRNLLAAWRLCLGEDVDAAVMLDGDMESVQPWWVEAFLRPIAEGKAEFVSPLYLRGQWRAVSARNVTRPFLYGWFGVDVQHPLSGNHALCRPLLERLVVRDWSPAELGYGVETAVVSTVLAERRPWATAQLDRCSDSARLGHRPTISRDVLAATIEAARAHAPRPGPAGSPVTAPMTYLDHPRPATGWLEERVALARDGSAACRLDHARWAGHRAAELAAAIETGRLEAPTWFHVFARALLESRGPGRARPSFDYAAALAPLLSLRALTVWREIEGMTAAAIDAAAAAEVGVMRGAVVEAGGLVPTA